ncbi:hypothetical protein [Acidovorax sp. SUPP3334]|uniref:hypothetical protein n=1 Tax=Acidovorax sp. SUPP3334 TaxID=2920881 RepID=UPI0023DE336A|nr:hypothetical protein [Acidovorax sp. SUPP3334]GKT21584.1 hypothetical protein AVHM3334_05255 [Acidovorax sp. SUPP3334]
MQRAVYWVAVILSLSALASCKEHKPEPICQETVQVFERNGQRVKQSVNGIYLKEDFPVSGCGRGGKGGTPGEEKYVRMGFNNFYWRENRLFTMKEYSELLREGKWPKEEVPMVKILIDFERQGIPAEKDLPKDWWYQPAIPHKLYPIDLLPNFGLDVPDPEAGVGKIKSKPTVYWAIRGTMDKLSGTPYTTFCSLRSPPERDPKDYTDEATKARDPSWLVQAKTYESDTVGNTCRGYVGADNGKFISAMIDVPGAAVKDIDKIYDELAKKLSEMTVD